MSLDKDETFERFLVKATEPTDYNDLEGEQETENNEEDLQTNEECNFPIQQNFDTSSSSEKFVMGNSISERQTWSEPSTFQPEEEPEPENVQINLNRSQSIRSNALDEHSFMSLINERHQRDTLNFQEIWCKFQKTVNVTEPLNEDPPEVTEDMPEGFEVINKPSLEYQDLLKMVETLCRLPNECGLDNQNYACQDCKTLLGVDLPKANLCHFDGHYYCSSCISIDKFQIPSKIIYNWDFNLYKVSQKAASFLTEFQFKPFLDFKVSLS